MEDGGSHWYEDKKKETIKEEEETGQKAEGCLASHKQQHRGMQPQSHINSQ